MLGMLKHLNEWDKRQLPQVNQAFLTETLLQSIPFVFDEMIAEEKN